jgi:putative membrane protein
MMWGGYGFMGVFMWIFWILVIVGVVFLVKWLVQQGKQSQSGREEDPLDILKRRYARGEVNKEEFEQIKKDLSG